MNATVAKISALFAELQFFERVFVKKEEVSFENFINICIKIFSIFRLTKRNGSHHIPRGI